MFKSQHFQVPSASTRALTRVDGPTPSHPSQGAWQAGVPEKQRGGPLNDATGRLIGRVPGQPIFFDFVSKLRPTVNLTARTSFDAHLHHRVHLKLLSRQRVASQHHHPIVCAPAQHSGVPPSTLDLDSIHSVLLPKSHHSHHHGAHGSHKPHPHGHPFGPDTRRLVAVGSHLDMGLGAQGRRLHHCRRGCCRHNRRRCLLCPQWTQPG
jgi:hypothetical protein